MSDPMLDRARECREALFRDLNGRRGFDTGNIDAETLSEWKVKWRDTIAALLTAVAAEEREVCARVAEKEASLYAGFVEYDGCNIEVCSAKSDEAHDLAKAIRDRGKP